MESLEPYLAGAKLYGDDFTLEGIEEWHRDEKEGYANLGPKNRVSYKYVYHALNNTHGFKHINKPRLDNVLGVGSAYGDEFLPIIKRVNKLTILDPSDAFSQNNVYGVPCTYVKPNVTGKMPFGPKSFDLITCLGVLHHIPNVTFVCSEIYRCLSRSGFALIREPIVSMGDWSKPRSGLTKRERGIPLELFRKIINKLGFKIVNELLCVFPIIHKIAKKFGIVAYNSYPLTWIDAQICRAFKWNNHYHSKRVIHKFRPTSVYYVLQKQ